MTDGLHWLNDVIVISESDDQDVIGDVHIFRTEHDFLSYLDDLSEDAEYTALSGTGHRIIAHRRDERSFVARDATSDESERLKSWLVAAAQRVSIMRRELAVERGALALGALEAQGVLPQSNEGIIAYVGFHNEEYVDKNYDDEMLEQQLEQEHMELMASAPYKIIPHLGGAFGGVFGVLNTIVGAISIFRLLARAFSIGLSPVLESVLSSYARIFHGMLDAVASSLSWLTGLSISIPEGVHDWIILWFVLAGASSRLLAAERAMPVRANTAPMIGAVLKRAHALRWFFSKVLPGGLADGVAFYTLSVVTWPDILIRACLAPPILLNVDYKNERYSRMSFLLIFCVQTSAIAITVVVISMANAQTM